MRCLVSLVLLMVSSRVGSYLPFYLQCTLMGYPLGLRRLAWAVTWASLLLAHLLFIDDLNLLDSMLSGLKILIDVCEKYAKEFNIKFNGSKSHLLLFKGRNCKISTRGVTVNGVSLTVSETAIHLGHHMSTNDKECTVNVNF